MSHIYDTSAELVEDLKRTLKPYKSLIKINTSRGQRFPFISLQRCPKLDKCVRNMRSNDFKYNKDFDDKISQIWRKYFPQTNDSFEELIDLTEEQPPLKKRKVVDSFLDLNLINDQNEDLDFEEENNPKSNEINGENHSNTSSEKKQTNDNHSHKVNGFVHKIDYKKTNASVYNSGKNGIKSEINGLPVVNGSSNQNGFKIPKKSFQSIETIICHAEGLAKSSIRPVDAFNHLLRYLTADQWLREDVKELLITIAKYMVANKDFVANVSKFNELINKIKGIQYIDDDFWDEIIYSVDKKKSDSKNTHEIDSFLSNLYDYMVDKKISARIVCTEAVIIAYRTLTNHPSAKDLIELQSL